MLVQRQIFLVRQILAAAYSLHQIKAVALLQHRLLIIVLVMRRHHSAMQIKRRAVHHYLDLQLVLVAILHRLLQMHRFSLHQQHLEINNKIIQVSAVQRLHLDLECKEVVRLLRKAVSVRQRHHRHLD